jgi:hypothetical protein
VAYNKQVTVKSVDGYFWVNVWPTIRGISEQWNGWVQSFNPG